MITYNHEPYIRRAIEGVLMQKANFRFELCIGEDASSDNTRSICQEYAERHPDVIRLFKRSREDVIFIEGRATGRKNGVLTRTSCKGKYIAHCEGDDFWIDEYKLQKQYNFLESHPDYTVCTTLGVERFEKTHKPDIVKPVFGSKTLSHEWFLSGRTGSVTASLFYKSSEVVNPVANDMGILIGDWALYMSLTERGGLCKVLPYITAVYRKHDGGIWSGDTYNNIRKLRIQKSALVSYSKNVRPNFASETELRLACIDAKIRYVAEYIGKGKIRQIRFLLSQLFNRGGRMFVKELLIRRIRSKAAIRG